MNALNGKQLKILVTGAQGQLGRELMELPGDPGTTFIGFGRDRLDITDPDACRKAVDACAPDAIIHCAAYTAVDRAESDADEAYRVNAAGTRNLAVAAEAAGAKFCYISTDYVFDGTGAKPYNEYDRTNPRTVYGQSKLAGEQLVQTLSRRYFIVRTSWVYGRHGHNFVKTMLELARSRDRLQVVHDQIGSPTYTLDLARFLVELVRTDRYGIYHASNTGSCSWYEFACEIFRMSGLAVTVDPCLTSEFPRPAPRPAYSVLDHCAMRINGFEPLRPWREGLRHFLRGGE